MQAEHSFDAPEYMAGFEDGHRAARDAMRRIMLEMPEDDAWVVLQVLMAVTPPSRKEQQHPH